MIKPLIFVLGPTVELVTGTVTVHEPPAVSEPFAKPTLPEPTIAVRVPPQVVLAALEIVMPDGKLSLKLTPDRATVVLGLVTVKVSVEVPPAPIGLGKNDLTIVGGFGTPQPVKVTPSINIA